jgi:hypothetical protein
MNHPITIGTALSDRKSYLTNTKEISNYFLVINERESSPFLRHTQGKFVNFS